MLVSMLNQWRNVHIDTVARRLMYAGSRTAEAIDISFPSRGKRAAQDVDGTRPQAPDLYVALMFTSNVHARKTQAGCNLAHDVITFERPVLNVATLRTPSSKHCVEYITLRTPRSKHRIVTSCYNRQSSRRNVAHDMFEWLRYPTNV